MPHRSWFRQRVSKASGGGTYDDVTFGPVDPGQRYAIERLAVEDETTAPTGDIRVYVDGHGYLHWELEQDSPAAATLYWLKGERPLRLHEGESLVARFTGATSGDKLHMYLEGYLEEGGG